MRLNNYWQNMKEIDRIQKFWNHLIMIFEVNFKTIIIVVKIGRIFCKPNVSVTNNIENQLESYTFYSEYCLFLKILEKYF